MLVSFSFYYTTTVIKSDSRLEPAGYDTNTDIRETSEAVIQNETKSLLVDEALQGGSMAIEVLSFQYDERNTNTPSFKQKTTNIKPSLHQYLPESIDKVESFLTNQKSLQVLFEESKDVFDLLPETYMPDYKSFCWYDSQEEFQCLASVYLAGMPKCGTTDLFDKLMWHPQLTEQSHRPKATDSQKEYFYWSRLRIGRPEWFQAKPKGPVHKQLFSQFLAGTGSEKVKNNKETRIVDGTPSLLWDLRGWETRYPGLDEPPYNNADLIYAVTPESKILALVRNPTERLYSEYLYFSTAGRDRTPQQFHLEVVVELKKFNSCLEKKTLKNCCYSSEHSLRLRIALGVYVCFISDFLDVFGGNLLTITLNEYYSHPIETLTNIFYHIGVTKPNLEDLENFIKNSKTSNVNKIEKLRIGDMLNETKKLLDEFYSPYNSKLSKLLGDTKFLFR